MIEIETHTEFLRFRYPFRIAHGERLGTDVVFVVLRKQGLVGYGEATLPPYLGVTTEHVLQALSRPGIVDSLELSNPDDWFESLHSIIPDNMPALAALDMARWQIELAERNQGLDSVLGYAENSRVPHTFTLGVSGKKEMEAKVRFANDLGFNFFKLKLNGKNDRDMISFFRELSNAPFAIDANQAWAVLQQGLDVLDMLEREGCVLIEQPFHKGDRMLTKKLSEKTDIPIIADEACRQIEELDDVLQSFDGVNVKLQKCGGITPAIKQLRKIKTVGKNALIGCMSESSIGCNAAEQLTFLCDWADLDGPYLNANNIELCQKIGYSL